MILLLLLLVLSSSSIGHWTVKVMLIVMLSRIVVVVLLVASFCVGCCCCCASTDWSRSPFGDTPLPLDRHLSRQWRAMRRCRTASSPVWRPVRTEPETWTRVTSRPGTAGRLIPPSDVLSSLVAERFAEIPPPSPDYGTIIWDAPFWEDCSMRSAEDEWMHQSVSDTRLLLTAPPGSTCTSTMT